MANTEFRTMSDAGKVKIDGQLYHDAASRGMTLSRYLEELDPSDRYAENDPASKLDAFERQLMARNIYAGTKRFKDPIIYADAGNTVGQRFFASDAPESWVLFPEFINRQVRATQIVTAILDEIVAVNTGITGDVYKSFYFEDTISQRQMVRVGQGAQVPETTLTTQENVVNLFKYGRKLRGTYEFFRRVQVDLFARFLQRIAMQSMLDKTATAMDVLINGDGNSNAAINYRLQADLGGSTANGLDYKSWLLWNMNFFPYQLTTVVGNQGPLVQVLTLQFPQINPMTLLGMFESGSVQTTKLELAQGIFSTVRLVYLPTYTMSNVLVGIDKNWALEQVFEIGANLTETDKIIDKQFNDIVFTEVVGYDKIIPAAVSTLTLNA